MEDESNIPTKKRRVKPKVVKEWDEDEIFKLIAAVEDYPCIWNAGEEMYHNKSARENAWQTIGDIFNGKYDTSDMSAKWSNLRIQYRTAAARAKSKSGQGVVENPKWKYFSALSFVGRAEDEQTQATVSNLPLDISSSDCKY